MYLYKYIFRSWLLSYMLANSYYIDCIFGRKFIAIHSNIECSLAFGQSLQLSYKRHDNPKLIGWCGQLNFNLQSIWGRSGLFSGFGRTQCGM